MTSWLDSITGWLAANPQWLGLTVLAVACAECLAIVGLIVPGTVLLFAVAVLAGSGALPLGETLLLGLLGGLIGDAVSYALGRRFHQNIRRLPVLRHHPEWIISADSYFHRYGVSSLLVGRFIGPLRPMLPMVAGMCDMPLPRFIAISVLAAAAWSVVYLLPGWAAGAALRLPLAPGFWPQAGALTAGLALLLGLCIHSNLRPHPKATWLIGLLSLTLLLGLFFGFPYLTAFDQGLSSLIQEHRNSALDTVAVLTTQIGNFRTQLYAGALLSLLLLSCRHWRHTLFACGVLGATGLGNTLSKWFFARVRPEVLTDPITSYSMPSGHSSGSFAFFLVLAILAGSDQPPRMRATWVLLGCLLATAVAMSRVYLGVHWPTDVLAGAMLAICISALGLALSQRYMPLHALPAKTWWLVAPGCIAVLGLCAMPHLSREMLRYAY